MLIEIKSIKKKPSDHASALTISIAMHLGALILFTDLQGFSRAGGAADQYLGNYSGTPMIINQPPHIRLRIEPGSATASAPSHGIPGESIKPIALTAPDEIEEAELKSPPDLEKEVAEVIDETNSSAKGAQGDELPAENSRGGESDDEFKKYINSIIRSIYMQLGEKRIEDRCNVKIIQSPGGLVLSAHVEECDIPVADRHLLEASVLMAQPLPYSGFETFFREEMIIQIGVEENRHHQHPEPRPNKS